MPADVNEFRTMSTPPSMESSEENSTFLLFKAVPTPDAYALRKARFPELPAVPTVTPPIACTTWMAASPSPPANS
jgi:hypothetical protein